MSKYIEQQNNLSRILCSLQPIFFKFVQNRLPLRKDKIVTDIQATKIRLAKTILDTNDVELIEAIDKILQATQEIPDENVIGSKPDGTPLTHHDLKDGIATSEQNIEEGKYTTIESLAKKWNINL